MRTAPRSTARATIALVAATSVALPFLSSCYIGEQGFAYLALLARGRPVAKALADPATPEATRILLRRAADAQEFGVSVLGERRTRNFGSIVEIQGDTLVHVVQACAGLSFDRYNWDYPFVGRLPYRGYFDLAGAEAEASRLRGLGYDAIVRDADAFSTLGWLADPLWSFMASYGEAEVADLVLHESMHATAFRKGSSSAASDWNEGIATFVGREGSILYLTSKYGADSPEVAAARDARVDAATYAAYLRDTAAELDAVYRSGATDDEKRARKKSIIADRAETFARGAGTMFRTSRYRAARVDRIDNAWLDLFRLYEGEPELYRAWYEVRDRGNLAAFVADMAGLAKGRDDPLTTMRAALAAAK